MIPVGIVGCNYGRNVLLPAFRTDLRCEVVALAGSDAERTCALRARQCPRGFGGWERWSTMPASWRLPWRFHPLFSPKSRSARSTRESRFLSRSRSPPISLARVRCWRPRNEARGRRSIDFDFPELPAWQTRQGSCRRGGLAACATWS